MEPVEKLSTVSFGADAEIGEKTTVILRYPNDHESYLGTTLLGRGTSVIGRRRGPPPEEDRASEAEILKKEKEYGEKVDSIGNRIPEMVCHPDPNFLCSSTKTVPGREPEENDMFTAYLRCFFCRFCSWKNGIRFGGINLGNAMWDDTRKVGILNDFDLARFADQVDASGRDSTGTLPFMALDLLSEKGLHGEIPRRYRHGAESFAWSLICLFLATVSGKDGKNYTRDPHPLPGWFKDRKRSFYSKSTIRWRDHDNPDIPLAHPNVKDLAYDLHKYWADQYERQFQDTRESPEAEEVRKMFNLPPRIKIPPWEEPENENLFRELVVIHGRNLGPFELTKKLLIEMCRRYLQLDRTP